MRCTETSLHSLGILSVLCNFRGADASFLGVKQDVGHQTVQGRTFACGRSSKYRAPEKLQLSPTSNAVVSVEPALRNLRVDSTIQVLSNDPLIYLVPDLLTQQECKAFRSYASNENGADGESMRKRIMTRSNPPDVFLDISKLWPLPILSIFAGIPPLLSILEDQRMTGSSRGLLSMFSVVLPNVCIALIGMGVLAWLVVLPLIRTVSDSSSRTSVAIALNELEDMDVVRPLVARASAVAMNHPWDQWEAPVVTKYDPGAVFAKHGDASPTRGSEWNGLGGQRIVTVICYLNTLKEDQGGMTNFESLRIAVSPRAGTALVFFPADAETLRADDRTMHESLPPTVEKWIVQLFGRAERVPPPLGLPDTFLRPREKD